MPAPLTAQQIALYMSKRRAGSRQEVAAAAAGISVSSAHRIDSGRLQPKAAKPCSRRRTAPLAAVWEPLLLPLLKRHPALTPTTLLEHLQEQKPDQDWSSVKRTLQRPGPAAIARSSMRRDLAWLNCLIHPQKTSPKWMNTMQVHISK